MNTKTRKVAVMADGARNVISQSSLRRKIVTEQLSHPEGMAHGVGNCGIVALAAATGIPYREVHAWFAKRKPGNWKGSTRSEERVSFLRDTGIAFKKYQFLATKFEHRSLLELVRHIACLEDLERRTFIVTTTSHVQVVRGEQVLDQNYTGCIGGYRWKLKRIRSASLSPIIEII